MAFSINTTGKIDYPYGKKRKTHKKEIIKKYLYDLEIGKNFLNKNLKDNHEGKKNKVWSIFIREKLKKKKLKMT